MIEKKDIAVYVQAQKKKYGENVQPIYEIMLFSKPGTEAVAKTAEGADSGFPDIGSYGVMGFYYELDSAIKAMHTNSLDIRETVYNAGMVICRFPGLYNCVTKDGRIYFVWNEEMGGFYEAEEPPLFRILAM